MPLRFDSVAFLGFGVAFRVQSPELERLRNDVRTGVGGEFSRQDSRPWKPHVTIQNKATPEDSRRLHRQLDGEFAVRVGTATGLLVWEYLGGPWTLVKRIGFGAPRDPWSRTAADR